MDTLVMADNFLTQLLTNMQDQLKDMNRKIDENHKDLSARVSKLESHRVEKKDMPASPLQNPRVVTVFLYIALAILMIVAAIVGIPLERFL